MSSRSMVIIENKQNLTGQLSFRGKCSEDFPSLDDAEQYYNDRNDQQHMDNTAHMKSEHSKQPSNDQNYSYDIK